MAESEQEMTKSKNKVTQFHEVTTDTYPVFREEIEFIRQRRKEMGTANSTEPLKDYPTTDNDLVGLCLSGGGIRSATFNLGLLQALYKHGILKQVDYLSTVSGGGYIGSCLTSLLNSNLGKTAAAQNAHNPLWTEQRFPFWDQTKQTMSGDQGAFGQEKKCSAQTDRESAEKEPTRHLRYFSNYLTAEGNFVRKYLGPALAVTRGMLFNFLLIAPLVMIAGIILALLYQIPTRAIGNIPLNFNIKTLESALDNQRNAQIAYTEFVYASTPGFGVVDVSGRVPIIKANPRLKDKEKELKKAIEQAHFTVVNQWKAMLTIPLSTLLLMMVVTFFIMNFSSDTIEQRFGFSRVFSRILFISLVLLAIQVFGAAIVYWNYWEIPHMLTFAALLTFLGPKLAKVTANAGKEQKSWMKIALPMLLMALTPLILLYFTGSFVHHLLASFQWSKIIVLSALGIALLYVTNRFINVNKISLHNFYRDRLSRAYLIQYEGGHESSVRVKQNDRILLSSLYDGACNTGPYPIINANLNLSKKLPEAQEEGVFRNCESFIFSKYWCGSRTTGYIDTQDYEKADPHIDLGSAMAISGAAVNIGMGQGNMPTMRLLLGLLNVRLGYWAPNPARPVGWATRWLLGNTPGCRQAMKEWIGRYDLKDEFVNLSDGGHFDNLGVYEMLRRRCKYIIVGDAEADPKMSFQALAYIIRLARIDFGIHIVIDASSIKRDREKGFSNQHCTVGIIKYPPHTDGDAQEGYLLYCKSSLTGDEPEHLHEYRVKHPTFPHQSTGDQWFDEQQFEAYRELGFHVGNTTFKPISPIAGELGMEDLFIQIKEFWQPRTPANEQFFSQHARELNRIIEIIKNDTNLAFIDAQIFPEWGKLMSDVTGPKPPVNLWLPENAEELRAGFYMCNLMIQLMENVYLDLNLENEHDHPDNRGWMNLFKHWSWAGIFRVTWAISACTCGPKFQKFCEKRLGLGILDCIEVISIWEAIDASPGMKKQFLECLPKHLNPYEVKKVTEHIGKHPRIPSQCYAFKLIVQNPLVEDEKKEFCFGFALIFSDGDKVEIDYFRVQDHLRRMGLGRKAFEKLVEEIITSESAKGGTLEKDVLKSIGMAKWIMDHKDRNIPKQFNSMLASALAKASFGLRRG